MWYMCVLFTCVPQGACAWRHMSVEPRRDTRWHPQLSSSSSFEIGFLTAPGVTDWARLAGQWILGFLFSLPLQLLMWVQGIRTRVPALAHHRTLPQGPPPYSPISLYNSQTLDDLLKLLSYEKVLGYLGRMVIKRKCGREEWGGVGFGGDIKTVTLLFPVSA